METRRALVLSLQERLCMVLFEVVIMAFRVRTGDDQGRATHWFASFLADNIYHLSDNFQDVLDRYGVNASAAEFINIGDPLIFAREEDFTMFLLRWS